MEICVWPILIVLFFVVAMGYLFYPASDEPSDDDRERMMRMAMIIGLTDEMIEPDGDLLDF